MGCLSISVGRYNNEGVILDGRSGIGLYGLLCSPFLWHVAGM